MLTIKDNKHGGDNRSFDDSNELFEALFRKELEALIREEAKVAGKNVVIKKGKAKKEAPSSHATRKESKGRESVRYREPPRFKREKIPDQVKPARGSKTIRLQVVLFSVTILGALFVWCYGLGYTDILGLTQETKKKEVIQRSVPAEQASKIANKGVRTDTGKMSNHEPVTIATKAKNESRVSNPFTTSEKGQTSLMPEETKDKAVALKDGIGEEASAFGSPLEPKKDTEKTTALHKDLISYPYSIYLGSYKTLGRIQKATSIYREKGLSPYWAKVELGAKGEWYRVYAGYFKTRADADVFIRVNRLAEAKSKHTGYANLIGAYKSEKELETERQALIALDYFPYVIKRANGEFFLYTGAFYQKKRAEKEHGDLASKGIQSQVVIR